MQYTTEQFLFMSQACKACMVVESYVDEDHIGQEMKFKGSADDILKMLGSLIAAVGKQIVDLSEASNFQAYLNDLNTKALESLLKSLSGGTTEEYNNLKVINS